MLNTQTRRPVLSIYERFDHVLKNPEAGSALVGDLKEQAYTQDFRESSEAMELLVNFALGSRDEPMTQLAMKAVLSIAGDPAATPQSRAAIRELIFDAYVISTGAGFRPKNDGKGAGSRSAECQRAFEVPVPLLALALRHDEVVNQSHRKEEISQAIGSGLKVQGDDSRSFKDPNRFCEAQEILHGIETLQPVPKPRDDWVTFHILESSLDSKHGSGRR